MENRHLSRRYEKVGTNPEDIRRNMQAEEAKLRNVEEITRRKLIKEALSKLGKIKGEIWSDEEEGTEHVGLRDITRRFEMGQDRIVRSVGLDFSKLVWDLLNKFSGRSADDKTTSKYTGRYRVVDMEDLDWDLLKKKSDKYQKILEKLDFYLDDNIPGYTSKLQLPVHLFYLDKVEGFEDLATQYADRGLVPYLRAAAQLNADNPEFAKDYPNNVWTPWGIFSFLEWEKTREIFTHKGTINHDDPHGAKGRKIDLLDHFWYSGVKFEDLEKSGILTLLDSNKG